MARIENLNDFKMITSNITSFSHAYLISVNSIDFAYTYVKSLVKEIVLGKNYDEDIENNQIICYQIDNDEFDDMYVVNPSTISINTEEINKLMTYMETKSLRKNGNRVYIIYGFERLSRDVSNKILKFIEEPTENLYAILLTENIEKILPTIISRCQIINLMFPFEKIDEDKVDNFKNFLCKLIEEKKRMIAYVYDYFNDAIGDRTLFYDSFLILEKIISQTINYKYEHVDENIYICHQLLEYPSQTLINILIITNKLKCLIKGNINLNLLLDRYIIEVTKEFALCKK